MAESNPAAGAPGGGRGAGGGAWPAAANAIEALLRAAIAASGLLSPQLLLRGGDRLKPKPGPISPNRGVRSKTANIRYKIITGGAGAG